MYVQSMYMKCITNLILDLALQQTLLGWDNYLRPGQPFNINTHMAHPGFTKLNIPDNGLL
jgi:hypothetical protein